MTAVPETKSAATGVSAFISVVRRQLICGIANIAQCVRHAAQRETWTESCICRLSDAQGAGVSEIGIEIQPNQT